MRFTPFTTTTSNRRLLRRVAVVLVACGAAVSASASAGQASSYRYFRLVQYPRAGFGADYRTTRDAEIVDSDPAQVHAIDETFSNDWSARSVRQPAGSAPCRRRG